VFLLSPANLSGRRGASLLAPRRRLSPLAERLRQDDGVALGEIFSFISALYFRGKLTYARRFAAPPSDGSSLAGVHVITPSAGLRSPDTHVTLAALQQFAAEDIDAANAGYRRPLEQSARALEREIGDTDVVLLGSIASSKYVDVLLAVFGDRLCFPADFVGRGDMSRGGLLLRSAASGVELPYVSVGGAVRRGVRPPRLGLP
jgi:hypothetical protein